MRLALQCVLVKTPSSHGEITRQASPFSSDSCDLASSFFADLDIPRALRFAKMSFFTFKTTLQPPSTWKLRNNSVGALLLFCTRTWLSLYRHSMAASLDRQVGSYELQAHSEPFCNHQSWRGGSRVAKGGRHILCSFPPHETFLMS